MEVSTSVQSTQGKNEEDVDVVHRLEALPMKEEIYNSLHKSCLGPILLEYIIKIHYSEKGASREALQR